MWVPNTDPSGSGLIADTRFRGQEGAPADAPMHAHLGVLGVTGFLMRDLAANPLDYEEGGRWNRRREEISAILDATDPNLARFARRGGKMIVTIGTNDTLASPGAQLDYYRERCAAHGRPPAALAIRRDVYVGESSAEARATGEAVVARGYRGFAREALVIGSVDEVVAQLRPLAAMGYTDVIVRHLTDDQPKVLGSMGRLADVRQALA